MDEDMVNTIKFSQFTLASSSDPTVKLAGLGSGINIIKPVVVTWTTATRPSPPFNGVLGLNTDSQEYEFWDATSDQWIPLVSGVDLTSSYVLLTPDGSLPNSFSLSSLTTGILKVTTGTGTLSISPGLTSIDGLATSANEMLYLTGSNVYATLAFSPFSQSLLPLANQGAWQTALNFPSVPVVVGQGGTGNTSFTAYSLITAGITSGSPFQNVLGVGTTGQVLTSQGAGALPVWLSNAASGTVNAGLINQLAWYAASGTVVSGLATSASGVLITSAGSVPSISQTLPLAVQTNITELGTITVGVWNGTTVGVANGGTGNTTFTPYSVIIAGTGATSPFQNVVGLGATGQVLTSAGAGALPTWQNSAGTGTVNSGLINQLAWYAASGTTVSGLATANNGVLITSAGAVPSIASTLPSAVQTNITQLGTITTGIWNGTTIAIANGGTGVTSVTTTPTSLAWAGWDANKNLSANNFISGYTTTVTAAGTTTLTVASTYQQFFTGSTTQTVVMPVTSTLVLGQQYEIVNNSSGNLTVQSSGGNTILTMTTNTVAYLTVISTSLNTAAAWYFEFLNQVESVGTVTSVGTGTGLTGGPITTTGTISLTVPVVVSSGGTGLITTTPYSLFAGGTTATGAFQQVSGLGTTGQVLTSNGTGALPTWQTNAASGSVSAGLINQLAWYAASGTTVSGLATSASAVLTTVSSVPTWAAELSLALGGTNAALTANNGGIFYSTASAGAILAGTATAGLALLSGASTAPTWSTNPPITKVNIQVFRTTGANTYTPTAKCVYAFVELWGAGGGGGTTNSASIAGSGGGGGAYAASYVNNPTAVTISIGTGGTGGIANNGASGTSGGNTTYNSTTIVAAGGTFAANAGGAGGAGGTVAASTGQILIAGGQGNSNFSSGTTYNCNGGSSPKNTPIPSIANGNTVSAPANSGGGGGCGYSGANAGNGGSGLAVVTEYISS